MRAEWTASGACSSGSTAPPRGATRRAAGGAAPTRTTKAERRRGCRGVTAELEISRRMASERHLLTRLGVAGRRGGARGGEGAAGIVTGLVSGGPSRGTFTRAMLDEMNAQHAKEHAGCTRAETLALFQNGAARAFAVVRGLNDDQLAKSGTVFTDAPPMTAEQLIMLGLLRHIDEHMGSIQKTVGM